VIGTDCIVSCKSNYIHHDVPLYDFDIMIWICSNSMVLGLFVVVFGFVFFILVLIFGLVFLLFILLKQEHG